MENSEERASKRKRVLGVLRDALRIGQPVAVASFDVTKKAVTKGFGVGRGILNVAIPNNEAADTFMLRVEHLTLSGIQVGEKVTVKSMNMTDAAFERANVKKGEIIRLLVSFVEKQKDLDNDAKSSLICIACLIGELDEFLDIKDPIELVKGAKYLLKFEQERRNLYDTRKVDESPPRELLLNLNIFMQYSCAAYGAQALVVFGLLSKPTDLVKVKTFLDGIEFMTGCKQEDVLKVVAKGKLYRPGHYICVDHENAKIVLCIRGTMRLQDVLVDLVCEQEAFTCFYDCEMNEPLSGHVHKGMLICAERLGEDLSVEISQALAKHKGYDLCLTGHSLGAGVASLLGLIWAKVPEFLERNLHVYAFASPCVFCPELSQAPFTKRLITSAVFGDDIVSRLCFSSFKDLQVSLGEMSKTKTMGFEEKFEIWKNITKENPNQKLFPGGSVYYLNSLEYDSQLPVLVNPVEHFHTILLSKSMLRSHMPGHQMRILSQLL
eukprot:CAMPEP_0204874614 /NCGR_PEP_ID=MMETSP1348-20121228/43535_1 /ASSEMBLY_ACC=CAM_ASM_000700 /TAXON_ID=215587 /ORGANISM="Aplanochytrium stocchinoi, Strain GSBS06" /LENGTH=492 /DNA_ID=CAMNT_0052030529 /DNA_START=31 /DNA_END=1509 /DNA_ORIENTATION=+